MKKFILSGLIVGIGIFIIGFLVSFLFNLIIPGFQDFYLSDVFVPMQGTKFILFLLQVD